MVLLPDRLPLAGEGGRFGAGHSKQIGKQPGSDTSSSSARLTSLGCSCLRPFLGLALYGPEQ